MSKYYIAAIIVLIIAGVGVFGMKIRNDFSSSPSVETATASGLQASTSSVDTVATTTEPITPANAPSIYILTVNNGDTVHSPLIIEGKALAKWYNTDGTFPVTLFDANNNVLATNHAAALGNWMTDGYVDFHAELDFTATSSTAGTIVFAKDNPSGLPQNDLQAKIQIVFGTSTASSTTSTSTTSTTTASTTQ